LQILGHDTENPENLRRIRGPDQLLFDQFSLGRQPKC
jgi:hypothetical protein